MFQLPANGNWAFWKVICTFRGINEIKNLIINIITDPGNITWNMPWCAWQHPLKKIKSNYKFYRYLNTHKTPISYLHRFLRQCWLSILHHFKHAMPNHTENWVNLLCICLATYNATSSLNSSKRYCNSQSSAFWWADNFSGHKWTRISPDITFTMESQGLRELSFWIISWKIK